MLLRQIFDSSLAQYAYLFGCQRTGEALLIDPQRDIDRYETLVADEGLRLTAVAETHIHADFLSGARDLAEKTGATLYLSDEGGPDWRYNWADSTTARVVKLRDGDRLTVGGVEVEALHTPGHTPEHLCFLVTDRGSGAGEPIGLASGDFLFVGDLGRPDLLESAAGEVGAMGPAAEALFRSTGRLAQLAEHLQVWPGHGAGSACGKALGAVPTSTLGYERRHNPSLALVDRGVEAFVDGILEGQPEPPLYFSRMKRQNRDGAPAARSLGDPVELSADEFAARAGEDGVVVLDTRRSGRDFLRAHLPGSIWAPAGGAAFLAYAGSYLDPSERILLVAEPGMAAGLARALYRIGLDRVEGTATPEALEIENHGDAVGLSSIGWAELRRLRDAGEVTVLDVRREAEHAAAAIDGAVNMAHTRLRDRIGELSRERPLAIHCLSGARATTAASFLRRNGFDCLHVDAHFKDWRE